ncbi:MAG: hypothetical protein HFH03_09990 [Dorea sp.]|nr:hypothetical protein [Dorea sp.]
MDLIVVHPTDANGVEEPCRQALEQGIKVMCWDAQNVWRSTTPITLENADEILKGM